MAEFIVPVNEGKEKVRVKLGTVPQGQEAVDAAIDAELAAGRYESATPSAYRGPGGEYVRAAAQAAPSIAGGLVGAIGGGLVGGPPGVVVGESVGSMAGEALTQYMDPLNTGIEQPNPYMVGVAGAVPPALRGGAKVAGKVVAPIASRIPSVAAGRQAVMQAELGEGLENILKPVPASAGLFRQAESSGTGVRVGVTRLSMLANELDTAAKSDVIGGAAIGKVAGWMKKLSAGQFIPLTEFRQNMSSLGARIGELEKKGGPALGAAKRAYAAMWEELDDALALNASNPAGAQLRQAISSYKREMAEEQLGRYYSNAVSYSSGRRQVDPNKILKAIDRDRETLDRLMPKADVQEIVDTLKDYGARVPNIPPVTPPRDITGLSVASAANALDILGPNLYSKFSATANGRRVIRAVAEGGPAAAVALTRYAAQLTLTPPNAEAGGLSLANFGMAEPSPVFRSELRRQLPPAPVPPLPGLPMPQMTNTPPISSFSRDLLRSRANANRLQLGQPQPGTPTFGQQLAGARRKQPR